MSHLKRAVILPVLALMMFWGSTGFAGAASQDKAMNMSDTVAFADMAGRPITLKGEINRVIAIGSALRLYTYVAGTDRLAGVERKQQRVATGRPYIMANPSLETLPVIGEGHPDDPDPELVMQVNPDVIIAGDIMDLKSLEQLEQRTGVPVVIVSQGSAQGFDEAIYRAIRIIGKVTGKEDRASDVVRFMEGCKAELAELTANIPEEEKPKLYLGALSYKGRHGIESTTCRSGFLEAIGAKNVADELSTAGPVMIDKEKLIQWDPDIIVIDAGGLGVVKQDYAKNPSFYEALSSVKNKKVYVQLPDVAYYRNIETAIVDLYFMGKLLYPKAFKQIDPERKADEIYTFMLGCPLYKKMAELYGGFTAITLGP